MVCEGDWKRTGARINFGGRRRRRGGGAGELAHALAVVLAAPGLSAAVL